MRRLQINCTALLSLGVAIACGKDYDKKDIVAPDGRLASASAASRTDVIDHDVSENGKIAIRDDCDPSDPAWAPSGGCVLKGGDVTFAEFGAELSSPFSVAVVGHQAWRNDPSYLEISTGKNVRIRNEGGRTHTFTEVAQFGGGRVPNPALNKGLITAPECPGSVDIPPGGSTDITSLVAGNHKFQCCIHPWMRAMIKIDDHGDH
jgi:plastocyanin